MIDLIHGIILGVIQGLTEFFPVSSSGHLVFVPALFGWKDQGVAFDTVVHGGTLLAVLAVFWADIRRTVYQAIHQQDAASRRLLMQVLVAAIPGVMIGGLFGGALSALFRGPLPVAVSLAGWGLVLLAADRWRATHRATVTDVRHVRWGHALLVGVMQAIALVPGTSRSGITMTAGLFAGMDRKTAVDFSFLVSIPTIAAAFSYGVFKVFREGPGSGGMGMLVVGFVAAAFTGFWAIRFLRAYVARHSFRPFVWYRLVLAAIIVALLPSLASAAPVPALKAGAPDPAIEAASFASLLVVDVPSGKTLYRLQPEKSWTPASLTKLMAVEEYTSVPRNWGASGNILASDEVGGGRLGVAVGSTMTLRDLLFSAVVGSANNAAEALARLGGEGNRSVFIRRMNERAQQLGLSHSVFHDAAGMDATNKTTAYDMAMLLDKTAEHPEVQKAMVTFTYQFTVASPRLFKSIRNTNGLLYIEPDVWVTAGKTGYLEESMHNLVTTVEPSPRIVTNGGELAIVVFGAPTRDDASRATATLAKWAWAHFDWGGASMPFERNRGLNEKGEDIRALQAYLNTHGAPVATSGAGSPGSETTLFGSLTKAALTRFQEAHAAEILVPQGRSVGTGYLDFQTRAFLNGAVTPSVETAVVTAPAVTAETLSLRFSQDASVGITREDVRALQRWLNANGFLLATAGPGAPGSETAYFGPLTQAALLRFQAARNLQKTGILDILTRKAIGT